MNHSSCNGCTLADFVMPFFLFIVGVAIAFAMKDEYFAEGSKHGCRCEEAQRQNTENAFFGLATARRILSRSRRPCLESGHEGDRWCGILQRIALVYFVVALIVVFTIKVRPSTVCSGPYAVAPSSMPTGGNGWYGGLTICTRNLLRIRTKDCTFSSPEIGPLCADAPACCLAPFEPEGLLSSISSILSGTIRIQYGHVLIHFKERLKHWLSMGFSHFLLGILLHFKKSHSNQ